jgi:hypothetical protein
MRPLVFFAALAGLACTRENSVHLTIAGQALRADGGAPVETIFPAFSCTDTATGGYLAERAYTAEPAAMSITVDFVRLGGVPRCQGTGILAWCDAHPCTPLPEHRRCFDVAVGGSADRARQEVARALGSIDGRAITSDAPHEPVLVRVIASAEPCAAFAAEPVATHRFDPGRLVGCAYSCPVSLDAGSGELVLDLDFTFIERLCVVSVQACAENPIRSPGQPGGAGSPSCARLDACCARLAPATLQTCRSAAARADEALCALGLQLEPVQQACPEVAGP